MSTPHSHDHHHPTIMSTPHSHNHHQPHALSEANKEYFNTNAEKYDDMPGALELCSRLAGLMSKVYPFDEATTTVMDYACGTGMLADQYLDTYLIDTFWVGRIGLKRIGSARQVHPGRRHQPGHG